MKTKTNALYDLLSKKMDAGIITCILDDNKYIKKIYGNIVEGVSVANNSLGTSTISTSDYINLSSAYIPTVSLENEDIGNYNDYESDGETELIHYIHRIRLVRPFYNLNAKIKESVFSAGLLNDYQQPYNSLKKIRLSDTNITDYSFTKDTRFFQDNITLYGLEFELSKDLPLQHSVIINISEDPTVSGKIEEKNYYYLNNKVFNISQLPEDNNIDEKIELTINAKSSNDQMDFVYVESARNSGSENPSPMTLQSLNRILGSNFKFEVGDTEFDTIKINKWYTIDGNLNVNLNTGNKNAVYTAGSIEVLNASKTFFGFSEDQFGNFRHKNESKMYLDKSYNAHYPTNSMTSKNFLGMIPEFDADCAVVLKEEAGSTPTISFSKTNNFRTYIITLPQFIEDEEA